MAANFVQSGFLRGVLLGSYRVYAQLQFWRSGPRIFVNSLPKAGTHLVTDQLGRFPDAHNSRLHILTRDVNRLTDRKTHSLDFEANVPEFVKRVRTVRPGQFFSAHLPFDPALGAAMRDEGLRSIFVARDPRDILVSQFHYVVGLKRHHLHPRIMALPDDLARYEALAFGLDGSPPVLSLRQRLDVFHGWLNTPGVLVVRFEDLVGARGGGDEATKARTLTAIAEHCGLSTEGIAARAATAAGPTATLRKGKANAWRGEIPDAVVDRLHAECGDLIRAYGYAVD
ncbi:sulfotransferase domain-containing protein [Brevundimonas sp. R86498]|uniref:sulfotransferase domain-containing protein n=1 Tax=Brevundimonas sp. R86498 TaxID=3093845 RepID=UPI0037C6B6D0